MSKMAKDHGFNATKSQYETRFKKWGIIKNRKQADWMAVAHHIQHRKAVGKDSAVFVQGNIVPEAKLFREIARVGHRLPRGPSSQSTSNYAHKIWVLLNGLYSIEYRVCTT
ncbi:hypothetical protein HD806DRAFT_505716 [Xylariaceae sp. AK1471]|nr:hypothetical protein HD806DRAFT_505716 [Xylariaceae sp. AK1471]